MSDPEVWLDGFDAFDLAELFATPIEPCESCGWSVSYADLGPLFMDVEWMPPTMITIVGGRKWHEVHKIGERVMFRPHTPDRCRRVRAGDPEPFAP